LERLIFYQLSELKRLQIRAGKSDERVLVKRLVEEYGSTGLFTGLKRYDGPFSFKRFEKYLYGKSNRCTNNTTMHKKKKKKKKTHNNRFIIKYMNHPEMFHVTNNIIIHF
jgi:hypothetical protein